MRLRLWTLHFVIVIAALALTGNAIMYLVQGTGLCHTQACEIVGHYVRLGQSSLLLIGALFFWVLWLLVTLASRLNRPFLWHVVALFLFGALAFDGGLLGYQFMGLELECWLCIGVGIALAVNLLGLAWVRQTWTVILIGLAVWSGGFAANSILVTSPKAPKLAQTAFVSTSPEAKASADDFYLFFSLHCGHCAEVLANLAINGPFGVNWHLCSLDGSAQDLKKLTWIKEQTEQGSDPFIQILRAKQDPPVQPKESSGKVGKAVQRARAFFTARGYRGVPLLIDRQGPGKEVILTGTDHIARFLWERGMVKKWVPPEELRAHKPVHANG